jgi:hypothetical protein
LGIERLTRGLSRLGRVPPLVIDACLAVGYAAVVLTERAGQPSVGAAVTVIATALTLILAATLLWRRRAPLAALLVGMTALTLESYLQVTTTISPLPTLIGAYALGLYATRSQARWGPVLILAGVLGYFVSTPGLTRADPVQVLETLSVWLATWALGYSAARRRNEHERARQAIERQAVAEEHRDIPRAARRGRAHGQPAGGPGRCGSADARS